MRCKEGPDWKGDGIGSNPKIPDPILVRPLSSQDAIAFHSLLYPEIDEYFYDDWGVCLEYTLHMATMWRISGQCGQHPEAYLAECCLEH